MTDNMIIKDILNQSHKAHNELIQKYTIQNINVYISALNGSSNLLREMYLPWVIYCGPVTLHDTIWSQIYELMLTYRQLDP